MTTILTILAVMASGTIGAAVGGAVGYRIGKKAYYARVLYSAPDMARRALRTARRLIDERQPVETPDPF